MKTIIAGSRTITDYKIVEKAIKKSGFKITEIVSGAARGIDRLGEKYGYENKIPVIQFPAKWNELGRSAGYIRNAEMAEYADALIAIWDRKSKGTKHMIDLARSKKLKVFVHIVKREEIK
jgi:hypothetical protein